MKSIRIGQGYDIHQLVTGRPLFLGGVHIPFDKGLEGHSDADVLLHAICDALLGAANLRDIGFHFPNTDARYKNIDSKSLLAESAAKVQEAGYSIGNIDATVIAEAPKINPFIPTMQETIAEVLNVTSDVISIKATTNEQLGAIGRQEGIAAMAVALIYKL
jgi:2-C-methyl-D-erythritol 2,4-cyclodiphosphate synthase